MSQAPKSPADNLSADPASFASETCQGSSDAPLAGISSLLDVMARLRAPAVGCPWDLEQDHTTLARYMLEEAYEVVEAIEEKDLSHLCEELGDVLLQIVFHAQVAKENGDFDFDQIAQKEADKMIERHPHVFGERAGVAKAEDVLVNWEADKAEKRAAQAAEEDKTHSVLDDVNVALPAVSRALKLQSRAARVGFDWDNPKDIIGKIREETDELEAEISHSEALDKIEDELGDVFFVLVNLARKLDIDPERALRRTNQKFNRRFRYLETKIKDSGRDLTEASLDEMENYWQEAKAQEKA